MSSEDARLSKFLENFSGIPLQHRKSPIFYIDSWVFWREYDGSQNNSSSADLDTALVIQEKIISALSHIEYWGWFVQFWAPVTVDGGRRVLSTSGQPFAVGFDLSNNLAMYRLYSEKYKYNINFDDVNQQLLHLNSEGDHMIIDGGPASAFLNRFPYVNQLQWIPSKEDRYKLNLSCMLPICFPSQSSSCIGVLELIVDHDHRDLASLFLNTIKDLKEVELDVFPVQDLKTVKGLILAKDEIQEALKVVCDTYNLALAQVWISYEDTQTKRKQAIKLNGYLKDVADDDFEPYFELGDVTTSLVLEGELALETLQDYKSRYTSTLRYDMFTDLEHYFSLASALAICLRSNDTGDFNYAFEFIWTEDSDHVIFLEALLMTLKWRLPEFKFAFGVELGNEIDIHSKDDETKFKIFQGKRSTPVDHIAPSKVICKTTPKVLTRELIQKQFGKTMKDAAKNLKVSLSTLKRKTKELGILEWPGPSFVKRNKNDSSIIQINTNEEDNGAILVDTNEEDNGAIEGTSTVNLNKNNLTIKVEYADDIIKFHLSLFQATFVTVEKELGMRLKLSDGTYKLKYLDEDGDWISLTSDEEMHDCIRSSRKSDRIVVRMRVLPFPQPT